MRSVVDEIKAWRRDLRFPSERLVRRGWEVSTHWTLGGADGAAEATSSAMYWRWETDYAQRVR